MESLSCWVAAAAYALYLIANGIDGTKKLLRTEPIKLMALGLLLAVISAFVSVLIGQDFMTGVWAKNEFPVIGKVGTPLLFDLGVYFLVLGIVLKIIFSIAEEDK